MGLGKFHKHGLKEQFDYLSAAMELVTSFSFIEKKRFALPLVGMPLALIANVLVWVPTIVLVVLMADGMKSVTLSLFYGACSAIQFVCL